MANRNVKIPKGSWLDQKGQRWMKGSNRTFMELKLLLGSCIPLPPVCSNRTFMELKYVK